MELEYFQKLTKEKAKKQRKEVAKMIILFLDSFINFNGLDEQHKRYRHFFSNG